MDKGPHKLVLHPDAATQFCQEAAAKEQQGFCWIVWWKNVRRNPPQNLTILPLVMVPHKSLSWRAILDLLFELTVNRQKLLLVNDTSKALVPAAALDQMGEVLSRLIAAVAAAPRNNRI